MSRTVEKFTEALQSSTEAMEEFGRVLAETDFSPKGELKQRLNLQQKGIDPGKPFNWRGAH